MFYVDVSMGDEYTFYYNMEAEINRLITETVGTEILKGRPISKEALRNIKNRGYIPKHGSAHLGMMGSFNKSTGNIEYASALNMAGITAVVTKTLAEEILERAKYYCPVDSGRLVNSGRIEELDDDKCRIYFDTEYAWYVHEHTWKNHTPPTCAKFLTTAINEVMTKYGLR